MKKIKIVHFVCGLKSGGVEQMLYNYISRMDLEKFENYVVYQHKPNDVCYKKMMNVCKDLIRIPPKKIRPISNLIDSIRVIKKINPDIVHCHMSKNNFFALYAAKKCGVKVRINHSHLAQPTNGFVRKTFYKLCDSLNRRYSTNHVACGEEAADFIFKGKQKKIKVDLLYNKIDSLKFLFSQESRNEIRNKYAIQDDEFLIGTIGRLENVKNHERLIKIFKCICEKRNNYKLIIVGNGSLYQKLNNQSNLAGISDKVIIQTPVDDIYKYYSAMDCFVLPSLYEGLPLVSVEAQFNEVPVILSDTVAKSAKLTDYVDYLSLKKEDKEWASKIMSKAENGREKKDVKELYEVFDLNCENNDLADYYLKVLGEKYE